MRIESCKGTMVHLYDFRGMRIFNACTWFRMCQTAPLFLGAYLLGVIVGVEFYGLALELFGLGLLGGFLGMLWGMGKLELGCPICDQDAEVLGWTKDRATVMECPHCGTLAAKPNGLFKIEISQIVEDEDR